MDTQNETQRLENNRSLLKNYRIDDIEKPNIILCKLCDKTDHDMALDDLLTISLDMTIPNEDLSQKLPQDFAWALNSLKMFRQSYKAMLAEPTERIHLEGIAKKDSYIVLQNAPTQTDTNASSDSFIGGCTVENNRPCIKLVSGKMNATTFLHESVHHSDLFLGDIHFSDLPIYQTTIMLIDAQISSSGKNNKTVQSLRKINQLYDKGQLYVEGLAWITEMPMADLYKEKNHLGQNLKLLHASFTKALLEDKNAIVDCFSYFKPSPQLQLLLQAYNRNNQKVTNSKTILKQQQNFTNDILNFRREIGNIDRAGLGNLRLPEGTSAFCEVCGFTSLTSAVTSYHRASEIFNQTKNDFSVVIQTLQKMQKNINPNNLANPALVDKDLLTACFYLQFAENQQSSLAGTFALADVPEAIRQAAPDEVRKRLYSGLSKDITLIAQAYTNGTLQNDYKLAQASTTQDSVQDYIKNPKSTKTM